MEDSLAVLQISGEIWQEGCGVRDIRFRIEIKDDQGQTVAANSIPITVTEQGKNSYEQTLYIKNPNT